MKNSTNASVIFYILIIAVITLLIGYASNSTKVEKTNTNIVSTQKIETAGSTTITAVKEQKDMTNTNNQTTIIETSQGNITLEFYPEKAPKAVDNFLKLAQSGFYDNTKINRVIKGFMIQGGDPYTKGGDTSVYGTGGPGYKFDDEINDLPMVRGMLAMANSGPNTNGSQFFIITATSTPWLVGHYTVFGKVTSGMDTVDKIENSKTGPNDLPLTLTAINKIVVNK